jgi:feruloyl esterase
MMNGLRRYEFSERLAQILGESRRDLRFRVTLLVTGGIVPPGPRGRGSPPATPQYAANLLLGTMAAPQQAHTIEAIHCYRELRPTVMGADASGPRVIFGPHAKAPEADTLPALPLLSGRLRFGEVMIRLLELALATETRATLARELLGIRISRSFPAAAVQIGGWSQGRRTVLTQRYELAEGARPPAWLDPDRGGVADPGLLHSVFLPADKLIEIGALTTFPAKEGYPMINLGPKMASVANLVNLAKKTRYRQRWEKLLEAFRNAQAWTDKVDTADNRLVEVTGFGSNPGNLRMLTYTPDHLPASPALVVALHGATQTAASYDKGAGWSTLADRHGFAVLLPQQHWINNPLRAFNWFRPEDTERNGGEPLSIKQMIDRMIADHGIDPRRVYVSGVSSGGAMTSVMLATYPEVFAGGAVIAGIPYRSADGLQDAFESMFQGRRRSGDEWSELVRVASAHQGPWPKLSVWHGDADSAVTPLNAGEIVKQWTALHGLDETPTIEKTVADYPHQVWQGADGEDLVESYTITGMTHGVPVHPGNAEHQCGTAAPYFLDVGISSTYHIANFFELTSPLSQTEAADRTSASAGTTTAPEPSEIPASDSSDSDKATTVRVVSGEHVPASEAFSSERPDADETPRRPAGDGPLGVDIPGIISQSLAAAGLLKGARGADSESRAKANGPLGIDVQGIINTSLEAAGLLKEGSKHSRGASGPLGIDIAGIIASSLEAADVLHDRVRNASKATVDADDVAKSDWRGEGWERRAGDDPNAFREGSVLFGQAASGEGDDLGNEVRSVSRRLTLGSQPELSYVRKLHLRAGVNDYTRASFRVLVDGLPVDEVIAVGMDHVESHWLQRADIDLAPFADRTVTLTFEVAASANVRNPVFAKAWVDRISVRSAAAVE